MIYTVIYEDMTVAEMADVTAKMLDTDSVSISYGDIDNASTPLSEGLTYEENPYTLTIGKAEMADTGKMTLTVERYGEEGTYEVELTQEK